MLSNIGAAGQADFRRTGDFGLRSTKRLAKSTGEASTTPSAASYGVQSKHQAPNHK